MAARRDTCRQSGHPGTCRDARPSCSRHGTPAQESAGTRTQSSLAGPQAEDRSETIRAVAQTRRYPHRWFDRGRDAFQRLAPKAPAVYACPLCARGFFRSAVVKRTLTIEHAPPESLGGRPICLTCTYCNNTAGHTVDVHMRRRETVTDFVLGTMTESRPARFQVHGASMAASYYNGPGGVFVKGVPKANRPSAPEEVRAEMHRPVPAAHGPLTFHVTLTQDAYDHRLANLGWLRSAFLVAFSAFGYCYAFHRSLEPVRRQLAARDAPILDHFAVLLPKAPKDERRLLIVTAPEDLCSIAVQMGRHLVFLPAPWEPDGLYEKLAARSEDAARHRGHRFDANLDFKQVPWPQEPMHLLDLDLLPGYRRSA